MIEEESKIARSTIEFVLPNIVYLGELKDLVEREIGRSDSAQALVDNIKKAISEETDNTKKTDWRIFLGEFRRRTSSKS